jgi:hypothetical protein
VLAALLEALDQGLDTWPISRFELPERWVGVETLLQEVRRLGDFNDPVGLYAYCFCDSE